MVARIILTLCTVLLTSILAMAQAGTLDGDFDADGKVTTAIGSSTDDGLSIAVQQDGRIVVAGDSHNGSDFDFAVVRYNPDGSLDNSFSFDGKVTTAVGGDDDFCHGVAIQPDGKILLAGFASNGPDEDFALVRYNSDGTLDNSFSFDGKVTTAIGTSSDNGYAVALQQDGRIVVAGASFDGLWNDIAVVRYNADGTLDDTFSGDGRLTTAIGSTDELGTGVVVQQIDGKILVTGYALVAGDMDIALVRYLPDGTLDNSFDGDGVVTTAIGPGGDLGASVVQQPDGKILVGGFSASGATYDFAVVRYNVDGTLDNSFSFDGKVTTDVAGDADMANAITLQPDGKILLAGETFSGSDIDFALVRYLQDGALDNSFGLNGKVTTAIGSVNDRAAAVALQADGRILVAGNAFTGSGTDFAVARYLSGLNIGMAEFSANNNAALIYPNPLDDEAVLEYELAGDEDLSCAVFDAQGRLARTLFANTRRAAGPHREVLDLSELASGQYTLVLGNGEGKVSVRVVKQ